MYCPCFRLFVCCLLFRPCNRYFLTVDFTSGVELRLWLQQRLDGVGVWFGVFASNLSNRSKILFPVDFKTSCVSLGGASTGSSFTDLLTNNDLYPGRPSG